MLSVPPRIDLADISIISTRVVRPTVSNSLAVVDAAPHPHRRRLSRLLYAPTACQVPGSVSEVYKLRKLLRGHALPSWRGALGAAAVCAAIYMAPAFAQSAGSITAAQASEHVGETLNSCNGE
jgi:hypothetical protein